VEDDDDDVKDTMVDTRRHDHHRPAPSVMLAEAATVARFMAVEASMVEDAVVALGTTTRSP
jgi:hypothetical protein